MRSKKLQRLTTSLTKKYRVAQVTVLRRSDEQSFLVKQWYVRTSNTVQNIRIFNINKATYNNKAKLM